jgi:palmitoyltransferase ZDHHC2/15/20
VYLANCIGYNNHKHFVLTIFYVMLGCIIEGISFALAWKNMIYGNPFKSLYAAFMAVENFMISMASFSLLFMFIFVFNMVAKNTNFYETRNMKDVFGDSSVFNIGLTENIKSVMGDNIWLWWYPGRKIKRRSNGIDFKLKNGIIM